VSPQAAWARLDPSKHPDAPPGCKTAAGMMWERKDIVKHGRTFR
jgi:hypothetical protein